MKIRQLELQNFRCFEQKTFEFSDQFNVCIGDNATGKTAILDALAIGAGSLFLGIDNINSLNIQKDEIRRILRQEGETPTLHRILPVVVSCHGSFEDVEEISWKREIKTDGVTTTRGDAKEILQYARELQQKVRVQNEDRDKVILPVISYYSTGRLWVKHREIQKTTGPSPRFLGYKNCLTKSNEMKKIMLWFKKWELASLQQGRPLGTLSCVKEAIKNCMEDWQDVEYDVLQGELVATAQDGRILPFNMLSDGVKNMIGMVADIAYRCVTLNPQFDGEAARLTPGIVLIDEIDLHLHPKWQRRVVEDLKRTFPKIQFFATTHSEHIIQSLRDGELIDLNNPDLIPAAEYENKNIEYITENVMHVPHPYRNERYQQMMETAERYYQMLENANNSSPEELEKLKTELDELIEPYSDDVAYHAFLKMKRLAKLGD
ncbi:AAA family ATPase [Aphanizomenon sp. CS-733/32]|uniref:AAA family ATPase n=1 Tax=Aphanizomenon sp. CS-733/32 TaxID=3021715 RepID=UPI0023310DC9|nr:AAA family ATPase [Aphanizomenon sp. CS-733/32]MDB9308595.1 AAA family ATPase [Aphanizomenon sp. CS-733/32]